MTQAITQNSLPSGSARTTKFGVVGVIPLHPPGSELDKTLDVRLLVFRVLGPKIEVCPVLSVEMDPSAGHDLRDKERRVIRLPR